MSASERSLLHAVNATRVAYGLSPLSADPVLTRAAESYSRTLLARDVFEHGDFAARMQAFGARGPVLAENIAWGTGPYRAAGAIVREWMQSPPHRANLLRPGFRRIGLGAAVGTFQGYSGAIVVTADFAGR